MGPLFPKEPKAVTPTEFFGGAHPAFKQEGTPNPERVLCFDLQGASGGVWFVDVETGATSRTLEGAPSARLVMMAADFALLLDGKLDMAGRIEEGKVHFIGAQERLTQFLHLIA